ncbi:MAG: biotin-dependent carboxyltransferase family protein [Candidatus Dormibacteraeota bacterium]|nr:biotin-dependent carboxyltransferase family protein [Candidatus Dormibacteraeota bacterium]
MAAASAADEFVILQPGPLTTVQDSGRPGWGAYGVPEGGALDREGFRRANALVGNPLGTPALEFSYRGPTVRWRGRRPVACAVVGDEESVRLVRADEEMYAGFLAGRAHGYLAVPGGFAVERVLGGRGTCLSGGFGGHLGRALVAGDVLPIARDDRGGRARTGPLVPDDVPASLRLAVLPFGGSDAAARAFRGLTRATWRVETGDRVGISLAGAQLRLPALGLSQPTCPGAIQVSGNGRPIVLLRDHPTVGGYPVVAVVVQADLDRAAWLRPGQELRLVATTEAEAVGRLRSVAAR